MAPAVTNWFLFLSLTYLSVASSQILRQYINTTLKNQGICRSRDQSIHLKEFMRYYKDCVVVIGNLQFTKLENTSSKDFVGISLPNLREVTEFVVFYRVRGLLSLGQIFPNLARIRGEKLLNNYGLVIHDIESLIEMLFIMSNALDHDQQEIADLAILLHAEHLNCLDTSAIQEKNMLGLYGLLKIDRGGVLIWGVPRACFVDSVDWMNLAPRSRLAISPKDRLAHCNFTCTCNPDTPYNHCWNNIKCQIYLEGPAADRCHGQCLGCRKTNPDECTLCRHYTYNGKCISQCPSNTIILPNSQYCITDEECDNLDGWIWNNTCVFHCPLDYEKEYTKTGITCKYFPTRDTTCQELNIWGVGLAEDAEKCVFVNGALEIHIRPVPNVMVELTKYLSRIKEVSDYVAIYSSTTITSLDFLSSLKRIKGRKLKDGQYSLIIRNMENLQTLFTPNVTKNLKIDRGTLKIYNNPKLCKSQIDIIRPLFPDQPNNDTDIPAGMNGYSGGCEDGVSFQVRIMNETSVVIMFSTLTDPDAHYTVLYVRLPPGTERNLVPESCSEFEWYVVNADTSFGHQFGIVELTSLRPASTYAICIETYDPVHKILARSPISKFSTPVGKPEPPFIKELVSDSSTAVVIRWVDHRDYHPFIKRYILDVSLIEIYAKDITVKDQCKYFEYTELDTTRHKIVKRLPAKYKKECEFACEVRPTETAGAMIEEDFDVCSSISCDGMEDEIPGNMFFGNYVRTLVLNLKSPISEFYVKNLAPFRDYRFRLRACTHNECSGSVREVVRTLTLEGADVPSIVHVKADRYGYVTVKWEPPEVTNGPILSFSIEVMPKVKQDSLNLLLPQVWCVLANETSYTVKTGIAKIYSIRVCTRSMALDEACAEWKSVEVATVLPTPTWWWTGVGFAVCLYIASIVAGSMMKRRSVGSDEEHILEQSVSIDESEPPIKIYSEIVRMYEIPLRDTVLE